MSTEQLPDGLQLAVRLLDGDRDAFVCGQTNPVSGLAPNDEAIAAEYLAGIDAIRAEHAQRVTLQHHACDLAQRVADLEAENAKFREWLAESNERAEDYAGRVLKLDDECDELKEERDALRSKLAEIEAQEPVAISKAGNLFWAGNPQDWRGVDCKLYARPVAAQAVPEGGRLVPLTDDQLWSNDEIMSLNADLGWRMETIKMFTEAIERAHGIRPASVAAPQEAAR